MVTTQGCLTINRHLFASGMDETKPEIYIWEKKVRCCKYIWDTKYDSKYVQIKTYHDQTCGWGYNSTMFLILLLNVLVIALLFLLMNSNPGQKWLESQLPVYQEPKVHIYKHQDAQYVGQEKRYPETRESSELPKIIKTAKTVDKSLITHNPQQ